MIGRDVLSILSGDPLSPAIQAYQLGRLAEARALIEAQGRAGGVTSTGEFYLGQIARRLSPLPPGRPVVLWREGARRAGNAGWIGAMLRDVAAGECGEDALAAPSRLIVIDHQLSPEKQLWYREAYLAGHDIMLIHAGNDGMEEDCGAYRWCRQVFRMHWSPLLVGSAQVHFLPRGVPDGFGHSGDAKPAGARRYLWGFAGDPDRPTRPAMLAAMASLSPAIRHLTPEQEALTAGGYRAMLDDCVVAPCPSGATTLDTGRVYEALEAGCIPIVERREGFDYFREALGRHPMLTVADWAEAPGLIAELRKSGRLETKRAQCHGWWRHYRGNLAARITALALG